MIAKAPSEPVDVPPIVTRLARGEPVETVWRNELGGLTFRIGARFVKWMPVGDFSAEVVRLRWAAHFTPVPRVLGHGSDGTGSWLLTAGLPGRSAVDERWLRDPATAVRGIGAGLRALHDALPVQGCPFDWSAGQRIKRVESLTPRDIPPVDELVVCHGDACAPNTLLAGDGTCTGHVDLGALGLGDRWADLAIATWSTQWNYGPGWEGPLLEAYGVARDEERIGFYRRLWELSG
ncbi:aminoglycoside 3'-phosphotransferase [Amycolatopsis sp.]|uniref:aminoglycoside 3'-phosphotransferase n=1 Tax=Amycolatopsis sp. TaxID=37632 RepID=UPI002C15D704|nr:aminoglycoside 3'-phosphotransferase [Amycolatopsis sp.]HVV12618.1 aminoglycoside 3'-phosphotransferase [Amycolatopsis sp.]